MWSGMGAGAAHRAGWDMGLHAMCVGCRRRKLRQDRRCLRSKDGVHGACVGRGSGGASGTDAGATSGRTPRLDVRALVALLIHASPGM
jgi:hypothetical protein